ncbi:MAG: hypothetical protein AUF64_05465 [Chloroflexi bacterium 13_1_20CM_54_36]|nr:MAG: hypothetical protein AUF64_05465 [Chloroflexi bacterium 13_1_20CM_54_36]
MERKRGWSGGCAYGRWCVSSCWALMLVLFGVETGSVIVMAAMTGLIVLEKKSAGSRWVRCGAGGILLLLAAGWLVDPTWLPRTVEGEPQQATLPHVLMVRRPRRLPGFDHSQHRKLPWQSPRLAGRSCQRRWRCSRHAGGSPWSFQTMRCRVTKTV